MGKGDDDDDKNDGDWKIENVRSIRLKDIAHYSKGQDAIEAIEEDILPPFLLIFLSRRNIEEIPRRRIILRFMRIVMMLVVVLLLLLLTTFSCW